LLQKKQSHKPTTLRVAGVFDILFSRQTLQENLNETILIAGKIKGRKSW
jgi:hypothetical protein